MYLYYLYNIIYNQSILFKVSFKYNQYNSAPITLKTLTAIVLIIHMWTYI